MEEKKYTRDQIKDAIWQELKESDYAGENNERAYEVIGIVMAGIDKIGGEAGTGPVWVKAYDVFPVKKRVIAKMFIEQTGITVVGYASSTTGEMICFDWNVSSVTWCKGHEELKNLFWLDESAPSGEREDILAFAEWCTINYIKVKDGGWVKDFESNDELTTAKLYGIFKQQKEG